MNIIDIQDNLKNLPEQALMREMQQPTGSAPQFLVLGELKRRKQMRDDYNRQKNADMKTVAEEVVTAAGAPQEGIMQMARSLNPNTNMAQDTGLAQATPVTPTQAPQPQAPQMMSDGGIMRLQTGGTISAIAALKVNYPDLYRQYEDNPVALEQVARAAQTSALEPEQTVMEASETPRENDLLKRMFADPTRGDIIDQQKRDAARFGADYALDQSDQSIFNQQQAELAGNEGLFAEGAPVEYLTGNVSAGIGGSAVPFPAADTPASAALTQPVSPEIADFIPPQLPTADVNPRAIDDASDFSNDPRRGEARRPAVPGMNDVLPEASIANARADADRDDLLGYLRGEFRGSHMPAIIDAIDRQNMGEYGDFRTTSDRVIRDDLGGGHRPAYFPNDRVIAPLNRRAQAYMQSDMYTPPQQIYTLNSPLDLLKYEEAGDEEFAAVSDILARGAAAQDQSSSEASLVAQDAASDAPMLDEIARQAEARRMRRINEIPETGYRTLAQKEKDAADSPFMTGVVDPIFENMIAGAGYAGRSAADLFEYGVDNLPGYIEEVQYARGFGDRARRERDSADEDTLMAMPIQRPLAESTAAESEANRRAADSMLGTGITSIGGREGAVTAPVTDTDTSTDTSTSVGSSGRIAQMLEDRQKSAESDKWMALAQTGLALMASDQPTLGGAIGEAGLAGIGALQQSRQGMQDFEMDMLKLQTQIDAANRKSSSKGGMTAGNAITFVRNLQNYKDDLRDRIENLNSVENVSMSPEEKAQTLKGLQSEMLRLDLKIGGLMQSLDGGAASAFDVTGGSQSTGN